ncbi:WecB/TagA/CpsF family glycosyltransferase [Gordonia terrae]
MNAYSIASSREIPAFRSALTGHGINYADGAPLAGVLSRISERQGMGQTSRVRGPSLFEETLRLSQASTVTHFFFGASPETLALLSQAIGDRYPDVNIAGLVSPPVAEPDELVDLAVQAHASSGGDLVWLGLGTPKQDVVARDLSQRINRPCVGVGAAFDFMAGTQPVAPVWMQSSGLEWLYRFYCEPRRLWRRYTLGNLKFARIALPAFVRGA